MNFSEIYKRLAKIAPAAERKLIPAAEKGIAELAEEFPLIARKATIPAETEAVQVLGKGQRAAQKAGNIIDAELVAPKVSTLDAIKEFAKNNKGKIAGGLTIAELARQMMGQSDNGGGSELPPMTPKQEAPNGSILPDNYNALAEAEDTSYTGEKKGGSKEAPLIEDEASHGEAPAEKPQDIDYEALMANAQQGSNQNQYMNNLLHAATQAGAAIAGSGTKADYSSVDAQKEGIEAPTKNLSNLMATTVSSNKLKQAKSELEDDAKMADPNSEVSKLTTELAVKAGLIKPGTRMSAASLKSSGVNLGNLLSTIEAGKARKESAQLQREATGAARDETNRFKAQASVDKQVSQLLKSKDIEAYNAANDAILALDNATDDKDNKIKTGSAFMQYAKIAQGDNSVVRDGDMAQLAGRYNYTSVSDMFNKLRAQASGGNFGTVELQAMKEVASLTKQIKGRRVQELMSPIIERAKAHSLNLKESMDPSFVERFSPQEAKIEVTTPQKPGTIVIKAPSGKTLAVSPENAAEYLKRPGYSKVE